MKAVLHMRGSELPNCFSAPASGIHITRENGVLKIPNFRLGRERDENMVKQSFFPYFIKVFESSTFPYKKEVETSSITRRSVKQGKDVLCFSLDKTDSWLLCADTAPEKKGFNAAVSPLKAIRVTNRLKEESKKANLFLSRWWRSLRIMANEIGFKHLGKQLLSYFPMKGSRQLCGLQK